MTDSHGPFRGERFVLELRGSEIEGFTEVELPQHVTQQSEYRSGQDAAHKQQLWGANHYEDLVVTRAVDDQTTLFDWRKEVEQGKQEQAREDSIAIILKTPEGQSGLRWNFTNAWPKEYRTPDLNANSNEVATETLVIAHEGMEREVQ